MKIMLGVLLTCFIAIAYLRASKQATISQKEALQNVLRYKQQFGISCAPNLTLFNLNDSANIIPLLDGWGKYRMPLKEANDSAYIYFQQGINMYYGFHIIEALASFDKSTKFDSNFAMGYWGKALSYGPNINDLGYSASPDALGAVEKAKALSINSTPVEKALIQAMLLRYSADTTQLREHLNQLYADAMKQVYEQFPNDFDVATLYVDAMMVQHPWDLYDKNGKPKEWTPVIVSTLEKILKKSPQHPGAAHYYIHAVEASDHPEKALTVADELPSLMPGVAHLVHMPAHIYVRTGYYEKGVDVDKQAVKGYENYFSKYAAVAGNTPLYLIHNLHMQATCANMDGSYAEALQAAIATKNSIDTSFLSAPDFLGVYIQYIYMTPTLTQVRFGKWNDILQDEKVPSTFIYANLLQHYARGLAYARKNDFSNANTELLALQTDLKNDQLKAPAPNFANPGINGAMVAEKILMGVIAEEQNNLENSITTFTNAVNAEDLMIYDEPKDWVHPARQYLGNVLIKAGRYAEAEKVFKEDENINPKNGWSYIGLTTALSKQGKKKEMLIAETLARKAFERSDIKITQAVF